MFELLETIQASEQELKQGLKHYECVEVDGMWFILDQDYQMMVLSRILKQVIRMNISYVKSQLNCAGILMRTPGSSTVSKRRRRSGNSPLW